MVIVLNSTKKDVKGISGNWVNSEILETISLFVYEYSFDKVVNDMGPTADWGVFPLDKDKRICNQYNGCTISLHELMFSLS